MGKKSALDKATDIGLFGRVLDDDDVSELALDRFEDPPFKAKLTLGLESFKVMPIVNYFSTYRTLMRFLGRKGSALASIVVHCRPSFFLVKRKLRFFSLNQITYFDLGHFDWTLAFEKNYKNV